MFDALLSCSVSVTCLMGLTVVFLVYWVQRRLRYRLPPGPPALPLLGNMFQLDSKIMHEQAYEWSKKYGPVISLYLGPTLMVMINDIDTALEVLVKKTTDFAGRPLVPSSELLTEGGKNIVFGEYGPTWHLHRKISSKALREYMQGNKLEERIWTAVSTEMDEMEKQKEPFDVNVYVTNMVSHLLNGVLFGENNDYKDPNIKVILKSIEDISNSSEFVCFEDFIPPLRYVYKTNNFRKMEEFANRFHSYIYKKFNEEERTYDEGIIRHFVDCLLLTKYTAEKEGTEAVESLTKTHLVMTCFDMFFAGIDTSRITLSYALLYMLVYPEIQEKVQEEIDRVVGKDRLPGVDDRPDLSYTEAVLHESMRLSTAAPTGVVHQTTCDTSAGGYDIPKGTMVMINHWALHNDPNAWEDVQAFKPERFLDENGKLGPKPRSWLPFSAGKRVCLGEFVAKPELHLFFAALMQRFTWKPEPGVTPKVENCGSSVTLVPPSYKVVLEKRH